LNKLEKGPLRDYETGFCSPVALMVLVKIFKDFMFFPGFSLPVQKIFKIFEPLEQILKRTPQGTFLQKISFLGVMVSEKMFKEKLTPDVYTYEMP
jgi:hypothetical protein